MDTAGDGSRRDPERGWSPWSRYAMGGASPGAGTPRHQCPCTRTPAGHLTGTSLKRAIPGFGIQLGLRPAVGCTVPGCQMSRATCPLLEDLRRSQDQMKAPASLIPRDQNLRIGLLSGLGCRIPAIVCSWDVFWPSFWPTLPSLAPKVPLARTTCRPKVLPYRWPLGPGTGSRRYPYLGNECTLAGIPKPPFWDLK